MRKISLLLTLFISVAVFASKQPDWKLPIEGKPIAIFKHNFTGIPVVETSKFYYGVNYVEKSILWSVEKPYEDERVAAVYDAASKVGMAEKKGAKEGFDEIPFTPFVNINNRFADVSTGNILIGQPGEEFVAIESHDILPELFKILVKVKSANGSKILYCIDLEKKSVDWKQTLAGPEETLSVSKLSDIATKGLIFNAFAPQVTADKGIVYKNGQELFLLNSANGEIVWRNECKPGTFFLDDAQKTLVVVKQASAAGNYATGGSASFGKTIFALDLKTGKDLWKDPVKLDGKFKFHVNYDAENFVVANTKGVNIYSYQTGQKRWKKDYETKLVQEAKVKSEGVEVFYGNKIMMVDANTGKKAWKKPIQFDDVPDDEEGAMIKKDYEKGTFIMGASFVGLFHKETGKKIWKMGIAKEAKAAFDNRNKKVAIIDGKKFYLFDPNTVVKKPEKIKLDINKHKEIIGFETSDAGYFITGMNEYIVLDRKCNVVGANYFKPLKTDRLLKAALMTSTIASGIGGTEINTTDEHGNVTGGGGAFTSRENARKLQQVSAASFDAHQKLKKEAKLRGASRSAKDYACFLKGEKTDAGDKMSIVKVDKKSGKEVDAFDFGDNRKVIFELDNVANYLYYFDNDYVNVFNLN